MTSPNPNWKPGDKVSSPVKEMLSIDLSKIPVQEAYKLIIGSVVPRPIAFVSTLSKEGVGNLAPFSFFNGISSNPPCVMISVARRPSGSKKDTLRNLEEVPQFVVNSANEWMIEPLVHCAGEYPYGVDEMDKVGLTPIPSLKVKPSRVKESAIQMECEVYKKVELGDGTAGSATVVFGKVLLVHVDKRIYKDGKIIFEEFKPIARLGGFSYGQVTHRFDIPVPAASDLVK